MAATRPTNLQRGKLKYTTKNIVHVRMPARRLIIFRLRGTGRTVRTIKPFDIQDLFPVPVRSRENHKESQSGYPVSESRFESRTSDIRSGVLTTQPRFVFSEADGNEAF
jgi:hypothetical protein